MDRYRKTIFELLTVKVFLFFLPAYDVLMDFIAGMQFQYEPHHRTKLPLLRANEELIETLEDNQVQLQNLMSSKYIAHFLDEVSSWQSKLSVVDSVISIWFVVQRTWTHLESIFLGSEDIRSQLPEVTHQTEYTHTQSSLQFYISGIRQCQAHIHASLNLRPSCCRMNLGSITVIAVN